MNSIKEIADSRYESVRINYAYNFVGIMTLLGGNYFEIMSGSYIESLLRDASLDVRKLLVSSIHKLLELIGVI
jgi:hypothetical protein